LLRQQQKHQTKETKFTLGHPFVIMAVETMVIYANEMARKKWDPPASRPTAFTSLVVVVAV
jgi:hypothetical protein